MTDASGAPVRPLIEIAVQDPAGARAAIAAGADRLELCQALGVGGLTASAATIERVVAVAGGERVAPLVRPRGGGFVYSSEEIDLVSRDIRAAVALGVGGVVVGALTIDGELDERAIGEWRQAAGDADLVFHRAIDTLEDPERIIEGLVSAGVRRVLTSGGAAKSIDGVPTLSRLVRAAAGRIEIMAGGGIAVADIPAILATGVDAAHLSARRTVGAGAPSGPGGGDPGYDVTAPETVAAAVAARNAFVGGA